MFCIKCGENHYGTELFCPTCITFETDLSITPAEKEEEKDVSTKEETDDEGLFKLFPPILNGYESPPKYFASEMDSSLFTLPEESSTVEISSTERLSTKV